jgi:hypothetical protein
VGDMKKQFAVNGPRRWRKGLIHVTASEPERFVTQPIGYDHAFGGIDPTLEAKGRTETHLSNPVGKGFRKHMDGVDGLPLPHTEHIKHPVEHPDGCYLPMAYGPLGRTWVPRVQHVGTYDAAWIENTAPLWPTDFDERYFQAAPPDQLIPYPQGGETVALHHLTPDGHREFKLPTQHIPVTFMAHRGQDVTQSAHLDTVLLEPDLERFTLTWRSTLALGQSVFDVKELIVGDMSAAWHRARRFPGKTYYASLGELAANKRGGR